MRPEGIADRWWGRTPGGAGRHGALPSGAVRLGEDSRWAELQTTDHGDEACYDDGLEQWSVSVWRKMVSWSRRGSSARHVESWYGLAGWPEGRSFCSGSASGSRQRSSRLGTRDDGCLEIRGLMASSIGLVAIGDVCWWRGRQQAAAQTEARAAVGHRQSGLRPPLSSTRRKFSIARWTCLSGSLTSSATSSPALPPGGL